MQKVYSLKVKFAFLFKECPVMSVVKYLFTITRIVSNLHYVTYYDTIPTKVTAGVCLNTSCHEILRNLCNQQPFYQMQIVCGYRNCDLETMTNTENSQQICTQTTVSFVA